MFIFSPLLFLIPAVASAACLLIAWNAGLLRRPLLACVWYLTAMLVQTSGPLFSLPWVLGVIFQLALAVYLIVKLMRTNE